MSCLRPALLPDEFALGYQGRVMRLNGWLLAKDAMAHVAKWAVASSQAESNCAPIEYLAYVAGIPIADFVRHHTCHGSAYTGHFGVGVIRPAEAGGGAGRSRHIPAS